MMVSTAALLNFFLLASYLPTGIEAQQNANHVVETVVRPQMENVVQGDACAATTTDCPTCTSGDAPMQGGDHHDPMLRHMQSRHTAASLERARAQIDWLVNDQGGYFASDEIQLQPIQNMSVSLPMKHKDMPLGFFAVQDISKDTVLMKIPRKAILSADTDNTEDACDLAEKLLAEHRKGNSSNWATYISYLYENSEVPPVPTTWSDEGKALLGQIHGRHMRPRSLFDVGYTGECLEVGQERSIEKEELLALEFAYITAASRAWTDKLVPVFDMINHGDGKYFNVDSTKVHDTSSEYVEVFARRDIRRGEQLYLSYTECADEYDFRFEYVISDLLRDYGFVAAYPQRWSMYSGLPNTRAKKDSEKVMLVFDIDEIEEKNAHGEITKTYNVTFHSKLDKEDDHHSVNELTDRVFRLRKLWRFVLAHAKVMESEIEREISVEYYQSYKIAATAALEAISGQKVPPENLEHMACEDFELIWKEGEGWDFIEEVKSHFQAVDIYYNEEADDACLLLNNYLHACASNRPHYHEVFVHYPARYLDKVERVLFIGGGDSMVLHEVLKYDSLKKVVGLELDQQVIRTTFSRMGTQPHFDNDKVEWYFGDAAAALRALPREYYGTFDLVVVDILTEVAQALQVTEAYSIMDSALLLLQPNGIIIKNEDEGYVPGTSQNFTNHMLDVMYHDVPLYCLQAFVMGSHNVDFKSKKPIDHNVPTLYLKGVDDFVGQFDTTYTTLGTHKDNDKELKETQTKSTVENTKKLPPLGLIAILEAEETNIALSDASGVESLLKEVFIKHGLQQRYTCQVTNPYQTFKERFHIGFSLTCVLNEGSIVARCFDDARYCAFDVQLWNDIHKLEAIKDDLLKGIGAQKHSVYRVLGTGLKPKGADEDKVIGPPPPGTVEDHGATGLTPSTSNRKQDDSTIHWNNATLHSYDNEAALTQWMSQVNIGVQSIVKCSYLNSPVRTNEDIIKVIREKLMKMLKILSEQMMAPADLKLYVYHLGPSKDDDDIESTNANEDGAVVLSTQWSNGNVVAFWDGKSRLDINAFSLDTNQRTCFEMFRMLLSDFKMNNWKVAVVESFPRGIGNVMNFEFDYASREKGERPYWAPKEMPEQTMT